MNNYLSLNLVTGKLNRFAGGSKPTFTVGEQNDVQLYILDFPTPTTYPASALGDAFTYSIQAQDYDSSNVTLKTGLRGGSAIISQSSFSNLPTNINVNSSSSISATNVGAASLSATKVYISFNGKISLTQIPTENSIFKIITTTSGLKGRTSGTPNVPFSFTYNSNLFSFNGSLSEIKNAFNSSLKNAFISALDETYNPTGLTPITNVDYENINQISDYVYSFEYSITKDTNSLSNPYALSSSVSVDSSLAYGNHGKYGSLNFNSGQWNTILSGKNEAEIWIEAMINNQTISQGPALITKKMT